MVTTNDRFTLPVTLAAKPLQCAEKLLKWMVELDNKPKTMMFAVTLVNLLKECCSSTESKSVQVKRENVEGILPASFLRKVLYIMVSIY